ncbi:MAG: hypothetical protein ACK40G_16265 [Cytophagaceae bacterium]
MYRLIVFFSLTFMLFSCGKDTPKLSYKQNRYHSSIKHHDNVDRVASDKSRKNMRELKKVNDKNKSRNQAHLKRLNENSYKNSQKNDAIFYLY